MEVVCLYFSGLLELIVFVLAFCFDWCLFCSDDFRCCLCVIDLFDVAFTVLSLLLRWLGLNNCC